MNRDFPDALAHHKTTQSQAGMAVVMAILTVAIVASLATYMLWQQNLMLRAVANQREQSQLFQIELAALEFTKTVLREDARYSMVDHYGELWALPLPETEIEDWKLSGKIVDAQAKFNINNLIAFDGTPNLAKIEQYKRLLTTLDLPPELADTLVDWLDDNDERFSASGAEDSDYLAMNPPYRAANQPMVDIANLIRVKGYDSEIIEKLDPFICALPDRTPVNINTASPEVLSSVIFGLTLEDAKAFELSRNRVPLSSASEINNRLPGREFQMGFGDVSVNSSFFFIEGRINGPSSSRHVRALLHRLHLGFPTLLWRQQL